MTPPPEDLTADWPPDPDQEALARFAAEMQAALPALPPPALERIELALQRELKHQRRCVLLFRVSVAASVLLAITFGCWWLLPPGTRESSPVVQLGGPMETPRIQETIRMPLAAPSPAPPTKALLRLEEQESLFRE